MNLHKARAKSTVIVLCTVLVLTTFLGMARVSATNLWMDTFNDTSTGGYASRWNTWNFGTGTTSGSVTVDVGYNRLFMTIWYGAGSSDNTYGFGITLKDSIMNLQGDFVVQVDYTLLAWNPVGQNTQLGIGLGVTGPVSGATWMWGQATSGSIRLVRSGSIVTEYYKDYTVSDWTASGYSDQGTGNLSPELGFWVRQNDGEVMSGTGQMAFSNFIIVSGDVFVVPEYAFGALLAVAACFAAFAIIKRPKINLKHK